jgi:CheY-like chemotaxis protein
MPRPLILLVDDEIELLDEYAPLLRAEGYEVSTARSGEECLRRVETTVPDLIVADVVMPGINGFQLCRRLKQSTSGRAVPILLLSRKVDPADRFWAKETGAVALLAKPIDRLQLMTQVAEALAAAPAKGGRA